jgi:hypothetical protein
MRDSCASQCGVTLSAIDSDAARSYQIEPTPDHERNEILVRRVLSTVPDPRS